MAGWMTDAQFANKIDYEGGIFEAMLNYGLSAESLEDPDSPLGQAWLELKVLFEEHKDLIHKLETLIDQALEDE